MPLSADFDLAASFAVESRFPKPVTAPKKRPAPFSIRLSETHRARLALEAAGAPLGAYIKEKILGSVVVGRKCRKGQAIEDREALARALTLLGRTHLSASLTELAHAASIGTLPVTPETEAELLAALRDVREMRSLLLTALGMKPRVSA